MDIIIDDLKAEIKDCTAAEYAAQADYEKSVGLAKKLKGELEEKKTTLEGTIASRKEDKLAEEESKSENEADKTSEEDYKKEIEVDCNWLIDAFDKRAQARAAEMDGLVTAKEYLLGAAVSAE